MIKTLILFADTGHIIDIGKEMKFRGNKSDMEIGILFVDIEIIKQIMEIGILFVDTSNQTACLTLSSY